MARGKKAAKESLESIMARPVDPDANYACMDNLSREEREKLTNGDVFWLQLVNKALSGDMKAMQEVLDRQFGKAPQHILQENHNVTYINFLEGIAAQELQTPPTIDIVPQVGKIESPEDGGPSGADILEDLGLSSNE